MACPSPKESSKMIPALVMFWSMTILRMTCTTESPGGSTCTRYFCSSAVRSRHCLWDGSSLVIALDSPKIIYIKHGILKVQLTNQVIKGLALSLILARPIPTHSDRRDDAFRCWSFLLSAVMEARVTEVTGVTGSLLHLVL